LITRSELTTKVTKGREGAASARSEKGKGVATRGGGMRTHKSGGDLRQRVAAGIKKIRGSRG